MLNYRPTMDQLALAAELESAILAIMPVARLHGGRADEDAAWAGLVALGVVSAGLPERLGGSDLGIVERSLLAITLGRQLASPAAFITMAALETIVAAKLGDLDTRVTAAVGPAGRWIGDAAARYIWVDDHGDQAALYAIPGETVVIDHGTWGLPLVEGALGPAVAVMSNAATMYGRLLLAAGLSGIATGALDLAVDYAKLREQFGRPIGSFQAIKHHCANMAIAARGATDLVGFAAAACSDRRSDATQAVNSAFAMATRAAVDNAGLCIQVHGGIGFSAEADPHLYLKRAQLLAAAGGGYGRALARIAEGGSA